MNAKVQQLHPHRERVYVKITSDFDTTGYIQPKSITWDDGRVFQIDSATGFRPVSAIMPGSTMLGNCFTIVIHGEMRHLFFERSDSLFSSQFGRWFVERTAI